MANDRHLGDGAYVSFDGYQFWLAANHHENKVVALDPMALLALIEYASDHLNKEVYAKKLREIANDCAASVSGAPGTYGDCDPNAPFDSSKPYGGNGSIPF